MEVWLRQNMAYVHPVHRPMPFPVPGWMWERDFGASLYTDRMAFMHRVDQLGIDGLIFTEHHYGPNGGLTPSPLVMLAAATQVTERTKLVTMGISLALYGQPVRVAEELAMVDNLSHGRLVVGVISAGAQNLYAHSLAAEEERPRYHEALELILRAWTDPNPFAWHSDHYDYECVSILPRPLQQPHPPLWTTASSEQSLQWAAKHHIGLIANGNVPEVIPIIKYFRDFAERECGWSPGPESIGISRELCVAPTQEEAEALADRILNGDRSDIVENIEGAPQLVEMGRRIRENRSYAYRGDVAPRANRGRSVEGISGGGFIVGSPERVTEEIRAQRDACGAGVLVMRTEMSDLGLDQVGDELQLFAETVLPNLRP